MKQKFIYDIIHGNIELSDFEFHLLRHPLVNRLHQVLQTSICYTVYPNMKTSRFEHSLGVLNNTGKIYTSGLVNSGRKIEFYEDKLNWLLTKKLSFGENLMTYLSIKKEDYHQFKNSLTKYFEIDYENNLNKIYTNKKFISYSKEIVGNGFLERNLNIAEEKHLLINALLFQATRLFGLLHDVGHLPLSHLFEHSIESVFDEIDDLTKKNQLAIDYEKKVREIIGLGRADDKIHEAIGLAVTKLILEDLLGRIVGNNDLEEEKKFAYAITILTIKEIWLEITKGKNGYLNSLYGIVANTVDSDRMDYVQRDGFVSGIAKSVGNIDRIISMMCLGNNPEWKNSDMDKYLFMPSIQSLDSIEELLHHRFRIYKYAISHHAVLRTNEIVKKIIINKFHDELQNNSHNGNESTHRPKYLINVIDFVHEITEPELNKGRRQSLESRFIQLTDFWLLSTLNLDFVKTFNKREDEFDVQDLMLIELYKNKRKFKSLWKRNHGYQQFLEQIGLQYLKKSASETAFKRFCNSSSENKNQIKYLCDIKKKLFPKYEEIYLHENNGLDTTDNNKENDKDRLKELFQSIGQLIVNNSKLADKSGHQSRMLLEKYCYSKGKKYSILISLPHVPHGFKDKDYLIDKTNQDSTYLLSSCSDIVDTIKWRSNNYLGFFVYFYERRRHKNGSKVDKSKLIGLIVNYLIENYAIPFEKIKKLSP